MRAWLRDRSFQQIRLQHRSESGWVQRWRASDREFARIPWRNSHQSDPSYSQRRSVVLCSDRLVAIPSPIEAEHRQRSKIQQLHHRVPASNVRLRSWSLRVLEYRWYWSCDPSKSCWSRLRWWWFHALALAPSSRWWQFLRELRQFCGQPQNNIKFSRSWLSYPHQCGLQSRCCVLSQTGRYVAQ